MERHNEEKTGFSYTYSAEEQEEIRAIRERYTDTERKETPLAQIKRLDASATQAAQVVSLVFGIVGVLVLGLGMSIIMTDLLAAPFALRVTLGILLGVVGGTLTVLAYPAYRITLRKRRARVAPEILRLSEELLK